MPTTSHYDWGAYTSLIGVLLYQISLFNAMAEHTTMEIHFSDRCLGSVIMRSNDGGDQYKSIDFESYEDLNDIQLHFNEYFALEEFD